MRKAFQKHLFALCMLFLLPCLAVAQEEKKLDFDLKREVLITRLENVLIGNDVNMLRHNLIDQRFSPLHGMAAYRELLLWSSKAKENDPFWKDMVDLVREGMIAVIRDSAMGIPLEDWKGEGNPISVVYMNGYPVYQQVPDFNDLNTLKWYSDVSADVVTPGSIGLSLTAKALLISIDQSQAGKKNAPLMLTSALQELDILTQHLFLKKRWAIESEGVQAEAGVKKIQGKQSDRGVKMLLAPMPKQLNASSEKKEVLKDLLGPVGKESYVPELLKFPVDQMGWQVKHDVSSLSSQASLMEGLLYLHELLANDKLVKPFLVNGKIENRLLGDWRKLVRHTIDVVHTTITTKHFDTVAGSFASIYLPKKGMGNRIVIDDANRTINVLEKLAAVFPNDADLQKSVHKYILSQAAFIKKAQGKSFEIPRGYMLKNGAHVKGLMQEVSHAISYVSIMLAAENITGDGIYQGLAIKQFNFMQQVFWSEVAKVYRLSAGLKVSAYTGSSFAMVMEWLRRMDVKMADVIDAKASGRNYIEEVLINAGLLQSEGPATGEVHQPEYYIENEIDALYTRFKEGGVDKLAASIEEFVDQVSDQDGDGIVGARFAGGKTGGAPVITIQVGVTTPTASGVGVGRESELQRNYGF